MFSADHCARCSVRPQRLQREPVCCQDGEEERKAEPVRVRRQYGSLQQAVRKSVYNDVQCRQNKLQAEFLIPLPEEHYRLRERP